MLFRTKKSVIVEALGRAQNIVERRNTMQILSNILLSAEKNNFTISATDLEIGIKIDLPVSVESSGQVTVNAKTFYEIVKKLPDKEIKVESKENSWIEISCENSVFKIVGLSSKEFPKFPDLTNKDYSQIKCFDLRDMITKTIFSVSNDETRYHLNGVYFEPSENNMIRMVATDGHRLSFVDRSLFAESSKIFPKGIIIPKKGVIELKRLVEEDPQGTLDVAFDPMNIYAKRGNISLSIRLINGEFPDYRQVVPTTNKNRVKVKRDDLLHSLERVSLLASEKSRGVKFTVKNSLMKISSNNPELGEAKEEVPVDYQGEDLEIGFNARYLTDCLNAIASEDVFLELNDKLSPGIIKGSNVGNYTCVVMPMKI